MPKFLVEILALVSCEDKPNAEPEERTIDFHVDGEDSDEAVEVVGMLLANLIDPEELDEDGGVGLLS